jgi:hypothetical protein
VSLRLYCAPIRCKRLQQPEALRLHPSPSCLHLILCSTRICLATGAVLISRIESAWGKDPNYVGKRHLLYSAAYVVIQAPRCRRWDSFERTIDLTYRYSNWRSPLPSSHCFLFLAGQVDLPRIHRITRWSLPSRCNSTPSALSGRSKVHLTCFRADHTRLTLRHLMWGELPPVLPYHLIHPVGMPTLWQRTSIVARYAIS